MSTLDSEGTAFVVRFNQNFRQQTMTIHDNDNWSPNETVTIRTYYGDGDRRHIIALLSEFKQNPDGTVTTVSTVDRAYATRRRLAIQSWTLEDEAGKKLPLTDDIVANLPPYVCEYIDARIDEHWSDLLGPQKSTEEEAQEKEESQTFPGDAGSDAGPEETVLGDHDQARERASKRRRSVA